MPRAKSSGTKPIKFVDAHGGAGLRDSASSKSEATLPSLSAAKGNRANFGIYGQDKWARQQPKRSPPAASP